MLLELVTWATISLLLVAVGHTADTWQFWCFLGTYWVVGKFSQYKGSVEGVIEYIEMEPEDQKEVQEALEQVKRKLNG